MKQCWKFSQWEPFSVLCIEPKRDHIKRSMSILFGSLVCFEGPQSIDPLLLSMVKIVRAVVTPFQSSVCAVFICCNTNMFSHLGPLANV